MPDHKTTKVLIEAPSGERFEADIPHGTKLSKLAADFFADRGWPELDRRGRGQRAVVELVDPQNPDNTKRLNGDRDVGASGIRDGDTLRIFPESIAGAVDQRARLKVLIQDYKDMQLLSEENSRIIFKANRSQAPDRYEVTFRYTGFVELVPNEPEPKKGDVHRFEVILGSDYPNRAPIITWLTPIFHPNIKQPEGAVCLGIIMEQYLPGLGLAKIVRQLAEMAQWRNYDASNAFNHDAAQWAANIENWKYIQEIGGHPLQGPIAQLFNQFDLVSQPRIEFRRVLPQG